MARPIFVVGSMGSGTTLMRLMLDSHPNIMIAKETGFMRSVSAITSIPYWNARDKWVRRIGITPQELDRSIESFYDEVFGLAAAKQGAARWGVVSSGGGGLDDHADRDDASRGEVRPD